MRYLKTLLLLSIFFIAGCKKDKQLLPYYVPGHVNVAINDSVAISDLFTFINDQQLNVDVVRGYEYELHVSSPDSVQMLKTYLRSKPYLDDPALDGDQIPMEYDTANAMVKIIPRLFHMSDINDQQDWLQTVSELHMVDRNFILKGMMVVVPVGLEQYFADRLNKFEIIQWAGLDGIVQLYDHH